jgi:hypothetical protein
MELVPAVPSERVVRGLVGLTTLAVAAPTIACAYELGAMLGAKGASAHTAYVALGAAITALLVRPVRSANASLRLEGALDRLECVAVTSARSVFAAAMFSIAIGHPILRVVGIALLAAAVGLLGVALHRDRARARFLSRVYAKQEPGYRIERDDEVRGFELLPPVLSGTITDAVIAHVHASATYRTSDGPRPLARVMSSLPKMMLRLDRRSRSAATLTGVVACCAAVAFLAPLTWKTQGVAIARGSIVAPACAAAAPYFEERLEREPGVGRATLLTHAQDPTIPDGHGVVLVVPRDLKGNAAIDRNALAVARAIPCSEPLALEVSTPTYRAFGVTATLTLEQGVDESSVLREAEDQVRELFEPDAHVVYNEHFGFGATEKTFGYRVRHVLRHVSGVKKVRLVVNGSDADIPLGPRDFPTLETLSISAVR